MKKILLVFLCMLFCFPSVALAEEETVDVFVFDNILKGELVETTFEGVVQNDLYRYTFSSTDSNFAIDLDKALSFYCIISIPGLSDPMVLESNMLYDPDSGVYIFYLEGMPGAYVIHYEWVGKFISGLIYESDTEYDYPPAFNVSFIARMPVDSVPSDPVPDDDSSGNLFDDSLGWAGEIVLWILSIFSSLLGFMVSNSICLIGLVIALVGIAFVYLRNTLGG